MVLCNADYAEFVDKGCPMVLGGPIANMIAAKAVALSEARQPSFRIYAQAIVDNAVALAEALLARGAALVTGGTDNHLVLLDVTRSFGITGRQAEERAARRGGGDQPQLGPRDPNGAWYSSGVRMGTPALTTLGMGPAEMDVVADIIVSTLSATTPNAASSGASKAKYTITDGVAERSRARCEELLSGFPLYPSIEL